MTNPSTDRAEVVERDALERVRLVRRLRVGELGHLVEKEKTELADTM